MLSVNWEDYKDESIEFVFNQSCKILDETFDSVRESSNKSYIALAVYSGVLSYCVNNVIKTGEIDTPYMAIGFGVVVAILFIFNNLLPREMVFCGTEPHKILSPFFSNFNDSQQKREMIITKVIDHDVAITKNLTQASKMGDRFKYSVAIFLFSLFLGLVIALV